MNDGEVDIVLVEDNPSDAELIMRVLRKLNVTSKTILLKDGVEALDFLFGQGAHASRKTGDLPKVILLDLKLPRLDGIEVLRRIKGDERTKKIPVVALTSSNEERDLKEVYELGVNSYVTKPIKYEEFTQVVSDLGLYWLLVNQRAA